MKYVIIAVLILICYGLAHNIISVVANQYCLARDFEASTVSLSLKPYCIRWEGDKEIIVPIKKLEYVME